MFLPAFRELSFWHLKLLFWVKSWFKTTESRHRRSQSRDRTSAFCYWALKAGTLMEKKILRIFDVTEKHCNIAQSFDNVSSNFAQAAKPACFSTMSYLQQWVILAFQPCLKISATPCLLVSSGPSCEASMQGIQPMQEVPHSDLNCLAAWTGWVLAKGQLQLSHVEPEFLHNTPRVPTSSPLCSKVTASLSRS